MVKLGGGAFNSTFKVTNAKFHIRSSREEGTRVHLNCFGTNVV